MKGYIKITAKPYKDGVRLRCKANPDKLDLLGKLCLLKTFLKGIELSTEEARAFLDVIDKTNEEANHEGVE